MCQRINNKKGETFIETLVAILILTIIMTGFTALIGSTAQLNSTIKNERLAINYANKVTVTSSGSVKMYTKNASGTTSDVGSYTGVVVYTDDKGKLYYYE